ncbi:MAG: divalent-cation tolerance protein CutA [Gemmatimonadales bacterium]
MNTGIVQLQTTLDSEAAASRIADTLVAEQLAACVQVIGPVRSTYRWQGALERADEWLCLIKTTEAALTALLPRLKELHPYDTPEIIVIPVIGGDPAYLLWVKEGTADPL